jgi:hypothetical protein
MELLRLGIPSITDSGRNYSKLASLPTQNPLSLSFPENLKFAFARTMSQKEYKEAILLRRVKAMCDTGN